MVDTPWWDALPPAEKAAAFARYAAATPVGRIGQPSDVASAIVLLLENGFVSGTVLEVDGGLHVA